MVRRPHDTPAWRVFGAALGAFAVAVQLLLSAWFLVQAAAAANPTDLNHADLGVICSHDQKAATRDTGTPAAPHQHNQCPACACPQSAKLLAPLPAPPIFIVLRPCSEMRRAHARVGAAQSTSPSPYASRAPPFSA